MTLILFVYFYYFSFAESQQCDKNSPCVDDSVSDQISSSHYTSNASRIVLEYLVVIIDDESPLDQLAWVDCNCKNDLVTMVAILLMNDQPMN